MTSRLLQAFGLLAVLGLAAFAAGGLFVMKDRVRIVVQDDSVPAADPTALLRDDLRSQQQDLQALAQALAENFGKLQTALEDGAERRQQQVLPLLAETAALRREVAAIAARLVPIEARLQQLASASAAAIPIAATPAAALPAPAPAVAEPAAAPPAVAQPAARAPSTQGFLTFQLPSRQFRFDALQDFEVVPELSRVGFDGKTTLHDFSGVTSKVHGTLTAKLDDAQGAWTGFVSCAAATLVTGVEGRDTDMRADLDTEHHPDVRFDVERFVPKEHGIDAAAQTVRGEVTGRMTIRGVTKALRMPVELRVDDSRRLVIEGQAPLRLPDYGVAVPSKLGVISMDENVVIWVALRARVRSGGARGR